ncbi:hypothetical protein PQX77_003864 [Marasmius sp. AFHP31]|nr:hypothetical protein PQX77_003864 [Marasmius sp. AFHP31]
MKSFFQRRNDNPQEAKSAPKDPYKLWIPRPEPVFPRKTSDKTVEQSAGKKSSGKHRSSSRAPRQHTSAIPSDTHGPPNTNIPPSQAAPTTTKSSSTRNHTNPPHPSLSSSQYPSLTPAENPDATHKHIVDGAGPPYKHYAPSIRANIDPGAPAAPSNPFPGVPTSTVQPPMASDLRPVQDVYPSRKDKARDEDEFKDRAERERAKMKEFLRERDTSSRVRETTERERDPYRETDRRRDAERTRGYHSRPSSDREQDRPPITSRPSDRTRTREPDPRDYYKTIHKSAGRESSDEGESSDPTRQAYNSSRRRTRARDIPDQTIPYASNTSNATHMPSTTYPVAQLPNSHNVKAASHTTQNTLQSTSFPNTGAKLPSVPQQTNAQLTATSYIPTPSVPPVPQTSHTKTTTSNMTYPQAVSQSQSQQSAKVPITSMPAAHSAALQTTVPAYPTSKLTSAVPNGSHLAEPIANGGQQNMRSAANVQSSQAPAIHASQDPPNPGSAATVTQQQIPQYNNLRNHALNKLQNGNEGIGTSSESENDQRRSERRTRRRRDKRDEGERLSSIAEQRPSGRAYETQQSRQFSGDSRLTGVPSNIVPTATTAPREKARTERPYVGISSKPTYPEPATSGLASGLSTKLHTETTPPQPRHDGWGFPDQAAVAPSLLPKRDYVLPIKPMDSPALGPNAQQSVPRTLEASDPVSWRPPSRAQGLNPPPQQMPAPNHSPQNNVYAKWTPPTPSKVSPTIRTSEHSRSVSHGNSSSSPYKGPTIVNESPASGNTRRAGENAPYMQQNASNSQLPGARHVNGDVTTVPQNYASGNKTTDYQAIRDKSAGKVSELVAGVEARVSPASGSSMKHVTPPQQGRSFSSSSAYPKQVAPTSGPAEVIAPLNNMGGSSPSFNVSLSNNDRGRVISLSASKEGSPNMPVHYMPQAASNSPVTFPAPQVANGGRVNPPIDVKPAKTNAAPETSTYPSVNGYAHTAQRQADAGPMGKSERTSDPKEKPYFIPPETAGTAKADRNHRAVAQNALGLQTAPVGMYNPTVSQSHLPATGNLSQSESFPRYPSDAERFNNGPSLLFQTDAPPVPPAEPSRIVPRGEPYINVRPPNIPSQVPPRPSSTMPSQISSRPPNTMPAHVPPRPSSTMPFQHPKLAELLMDNSALSRPVPATRTSVYTGGPTMNGLSTAQSQPPYRTEPPSTLPPSTVPPTMSQIIPNPSLPGMRPSESTQPDSTSIPYPRTVPSSTQAFGNPRTSPQSFPKQPPPSQEITSTNAVPTGGRTRPSDPFYGTNAIGRSHRPDNAPAATHSRTMSAAAAIQPQIAPGNTRASDAYGRSQTHTSGYHTDPGGRMSSRQGYSSASAQAMRTSPKTTVQKPPAHDSPTDHSGLSSSRPPEASLRGNAPPQQNYIVPDADPAQVPAGPSMTHPSAPPSYPYSSSSYPNASTEADPATINRLRNTSASQQPNEIHPNVPSSNPKGAPSSYYPAPTDAVRHPSNPSSMPPYPNPTQTNQYLTTSTAQPAGFLPSTSQNLPMDRSSSRPPSEEILKTPSSLAMSLKPTVSRTSIPTSVQTQSEHRKKGFLSRFKPKTSQPQEPYQIWHPGESALDVSGKHSSPENVESDRKPLSSRVKVPPPINVQIPIGSTTERKSPSAKPFTPFRYLTSKRNRTMSVVSVEANNGTATNTVGSPTASMHSSQPPFHTPSRRDPFTATQEWRDAGGSMRDRYKKIQRPGVVFDVKHEPSQDKQNLGYSKSKSRSRKR